MPVCKSSTQLTKICDEKFGDEGPAFGPLKTALEAARHLIHGFLQKKREKEPDPVEVVAARRPWLRAARVKLRGGAESSGAHWRSDFGGNLVGTARPRGCDSQSGGGGGIICGGGSLTAPRLT